MNTPDRDELRRSAQSTSHDPTRRTLARLVWLTAGALAITGCSGAPRLGEDASMSAGVSGRGLARSVTANDRNASKLSDSGTRSVGARGMATATPDLGALLAQSAANLLDAGGESGLSAVRAQRVARRQQIDLSNMRPSNRDVTTEEAIDASEYLKASNTYAGDWFGYSVAMSSDGKTLAVSAPFESGARPGVAADQFDRSAPLAGAVYIFVRNGSTWARQAYIKASNASRDDQFGSSLALSGDGNTLAIGAIGQSSPGTGVNKHLEHAAARSAPKSGAVYTFVRTDTTWSQQAYLKASNTRAQAWFGWSVALSSDGNALAVGAPGEASAAGGVNGNQANASAPRSGAVYAFIRTGTTWSQHAYIKASKTQSSALFGWSVALNADGQSLAVGAAGEAGAGDGVTLGDFTPAAGAVYTFARAGASWSQHAHLKASNAEAGDHFGWSVALSSDGRFLAVGAIGEASAAAGIDGDQANNDSLASGAVYAFTRSGTTWRQHAYLKASNPAQAASFGWSVALADAGAVLAVGSIGEAGMASLTANKGTSAPKAGAVYVFGRHSNAWSQDAYVKASNAEAGDQFGYAVALSRDGRTLAVGAGGESSAATGVGGDRLDNSCIGSGAVYVY